MSLNNFLKVVLPCIVFSSSAYGQQTFNKLKVNELTLPKETAGKVLVLDGNKKAVGATSVTSIELDNLSGSTSNIQTQIDGLDSDITASESNISANTAAIALKADDSLVVHKAGTETITGDKTITSQLTATSTTKGNTVCPVMTDVQMLAVASPRNGDCVYNSTKKGQFVYSSLDTKWKPNGGGAGGSRLNLLVDGSFEDGVTEGACSGCTASQESVDVLSSPNNEKALKLSFSASTGCYTVDKTTSGSFSNVQGLVGAWIKNSSAGVTLTTRRNGADTLNVRSIDANGYYTYYEIPDVTGSTSFGYKICATSSITGNIFVDETFAGPAKVTASAGLIGPWTTFTPTGSWTTNTTYTGKYRQVGQNLELQVRVATSGAPTSAPLSINIPSGFTVDTSKILSTLFEQGFGFGIVNDSTSQAYNVNTAYATTTSFQVFAQPANATYVTSGSAVSQAVPITFGAGDFITLTASFPVNELSASTNTLSSTNGNTSWASCGHTTSDFTGFGTVTNIQTQCKRDGDDLLMRGKFTIGTPTSVEARLALKFNGQTLTSSGTNKIPSIQLSDTVGSSAFSAGYFVSATLMEPSVAYITFGNQKSTASQLTKELGSAFTGGTTLSIRARIPIANWENSNVIVASLKDTPKTIGSTGSDIQKVYFGSGANCVTECTTGTCAICLKVGGKITSVTWQATGSYRINGIDGTKYGCQGSGLSAGAIVSSYQILGSSTSTYADMGIRNSAGSNLNAGYMQITCIGVP